MLLRVILLKWDIFGPSKSQFFEVVFKEEHWFFFFFFICDFFPYQWSKNQITGLSKYSCPSDWGMWGSRTGWILILPLETWIQGGITPLIITIKEAYATSYKSHQSFPSPRPHSDILSTGLSWVTAHPNAFPVLLPSNFVKETNTLHLICLF